MTCNAYETDDKIFSFSLFWQSMDLRLTYDLVFAGPVKCTQLNVEQNHLDSVVDKGDEEHYNPQLVSC